MEFNNIKKLILNYLQLKSEIGYPELHTVFGLSYEELAKLLNQKCLIIGDNTFIFNKMRKVVFIKNKDEWKHFFYEDNGIILINVEIFRKPIFKIEEDGTIVM